MASKLHLPQKATAVLIYSRPLLVFAGMLCAVAVMWNRSPVLYTLGVTFLFISMTFDLVDGWFAARFEPHPTLAPLADRLMDKLVYSIIFPLVAVGVMWRLIFISPDHSRLELLHAIFVLLMCITVLVRDNFASFMRSFAMRQGQETEPAEYTRLRTVVAAPVGALLYAHAFFVPEAPAGAPSSLYSWISWLGEIPVRNLFFIEIIFLIITFGSIASYSRKYGTSCLDELCLDDTELRRRILSFFPNALTVMNAMMGLLAVFFAYQHRLREAYLLLIGAAMFDKLDGAVARKLGLTEPLPDSASASSRRINLGNLMDDLADGVSFCIVPAWIFHITFAGAPHAFIQKLAAGPIAILYGLLGIARLIYFTLDKNPIPGFFKGLPTPAAALLVTAPLIMFNQALTEGSGGGVVFWGIFCFSLMIVTPILMNLYSIHYIHMGRLMSRKPWVLRSSLLLLVAAAFTPFLGQISFLYMFLYVLSPLVSWRIDPEVAAREDRERRESSKNS